MRIYPAFLIVSAMVFSCGETDALLQGSQEDFTVAQPNQLPDLSQGLIGDKADHPMTPLAKPAYLEAVVDPQFGTTIRRITSAGINQTFKPAYSTYPVWNADESKMLIYKTGGYHFILDGHTYALLKNISTDINPPDFEQVYWHPTDPDILYYIDAGSKALTSYNVETGSKQPLESFAGFCTGAVSGGDDPVYLSWDGNIIGLVCGAAGFACRLDTGAKTQLVASDTVAPMPAPSGQRFYFLGQVYDTSLNLERTLNIPSDRAHCCLGKLADGHDAYFGVSYSTPTGSLVLHDMNTGSYRVVVGPDTGYPYPPGSTHISAHITQQPGWVVVSIVGNANGQTLLNNELLLVNANPGGGVYRVCHHRSYGRDGPQGYFAEPHPVPSPSGTRIAFASDWGGGNSVDTYVAELPSYSPNSVD